jgi:carboxyl-terminal processing protease
MIKSAAVLLLLLPGLAFGQTKYQKDFNEFCTLVEQNYAYLEKQGIDLQKIKELYTPAAAAVTNDSDFVKFLEKVINEFHNGHVSLNINLPSSNNLIPSGADLFVEKVANKFILTDVRQNSGAEACGLKPGMEIVKFNDRPVAEQLDQFLPKYTSNHNRQMVQYALSMLFAGTHNQPRKITALENGTEKKFYPDRLKPLPSKSILEHNVIGNNTGYVKINNSLFNNDLIKEFNKAVDSLMFTKKIVIDLTDTPAGGNTTVARVIMGRFIREKLAYQQHEADEKPYDTKRYWVEYVLPAKRIYAGRIIVMVGHWTGSMGEGIALGFDRMNNALVVGTKMAGLIGAIENFKLTETNIGFQIPTERLYHINGTPREDYVPKIVTRNIYDTWSKVKEFEN